MAKGNALYQTPESQLVKEAEIEHFRESYDSIEAFEGLKIIWMLRGVFDTALIGFSIYQIFLFLPIFRAFNDGSSHAIGPLILYAIILLISLLELVFIVQFFRRKKGAIIPLHVFSALSLFNFPIGTGFSIYHYFKSRKLEWPAQ